MSKTLKAPRTLKALVIGFGNVYRRDDGVGFAVLNALREQLGRPPLDPEDDGYDDLGHEVDTLLLHQLVPELADGITPYDLVIFVDAHVGSIPEPIRQEELTARFKLATVTHTLRPCTLLAMAQELYGHQSRGVLLSIRGYDFAFGEGLSDQTAALVPQAVERVLALVLAAGGEKVYNSVCTKWRSLRRSCAWQSNTPSALTHAGSPTSTSSSAN